MEQVFLKMMDKAVRDLAILERKGYIQFKVVAGELEYGALEVAKKKKIKSPKAPSLYPHGEVRDYVLGYIKGMQPDDVTSVPVGKYTPENIRGNICAWCTTKWGKGTYSSTHNKATKSIEVYRHGG